MSDQYFERGHELQGLGGGRHAAPLADLLPVSLIDVVFLLLIFFFLNVAVACRSHGVSESCKEDNGDIPPVNLPAVERIDASVPAASLLLRIEPGGPGGGYVYYFLDDRESESSMLAAQKWSQQLILSPADPRHVEDSKFIQRYMGAVAGVNVVRKYGIVGGDAGNFGAMGTSLALFFRYSEQHPETTWYTGREVLVKADRSVPIGLMAEVMRVCEDNGITKLKFLVRQQPN